MNTIFFTLRFDPETEAAVRSLWKAIAQEGINVPGLSGHRPHITVAAYDISDISFSQGILKTLSRKFDPFPIRLDYLGLFPERNVVFLAPRVSRTLYSLHHQLIQSFSESGLPPVKYEVLQDDCWAPHCTLVAGLSRDDALKVIRICQDIWNPLSGTVEAIGGLIHPDSVDAFEVLLGLR